jgi:hypothetical protein
MTTTTNRESFKSLTTYRAAIVDACESAAYACFDDPAEESGSMRHYLDVMVAEYRDQARHFRNLAHLADLTGNVAEACEHDHLAAIADGKRAAYADALRVLDIASDGYVRSQRRRLRDLPPVVLPR